MSCLLTLQISSSTQVNDIYFFIVYSVLLIKNCANQTKIRPMIPQNVNFMQIYLKYFELDIPNVTDIEAVAQTRTFKLPT